MPELERTDSGPAHDRLLRAIALFKFFKATLLVTVGLGALELLRPGVAESAHATVAALSLRSERLVVQHLLVWLDGEAPARLAALGAGSFVYAAVFTVEGVGLWRARRWAEFITVATTLSFIPLEVEHLTRHPSWPGFSALALNLAVAAYLLVRLKRRGVSRDDPGRQFGSGAVRSRDAAHRLPDADQSRGRRQPAVDAQVQRRGDARCPPSAPARGRRRRPSRPSRSNRRRT